MSSRLEKNQCRQQRCYQVQGTYLGRGPSVHFISNESNASSQYLGKNVYGTTASSTYDSLRTAVSQSVLGNVENGKYIICPSPGNSRRNNPGISRIGGPCDHRILRSMEATIYPSSYHPSTSTNANMDLRKLFKKKLKRRLARGVVETGKEVVETGKEKLKRPPAGARGRGEGSGGSGDHEIGPPSAPAHGVPSHGQESNAT